MPTPRSARAIPVETIPEDATLLQQYARAVRAHLAAVAARSPLETTLETLRAVQRRAQPRVDKIDGDEESS